MDTASQRQECSSASRQVQQLVEQEALFASIHHLARDANANIFSLDFEELFEAPQSAEAMQADGDATADLAQWVDFSRRQREQTIAPMERFLAGGRTSEPLALYASLRAAEMGIREGDTACVGLRACLLQLANASYARSKGRQCASDEEDGRHSAVSRARSAPFQAGTRGKDPRMKPSPERARSV